MTRSTTRLSTTRHDAAREQWARPVVPAPRRRPEEHPVPTGGPDLPAGYPPYPLIRCALDHATALRPTEK